LLFGSGVDGQVEPPVQTPAWQVSFEVDGLPSLQTVPFALAGFEQTPEPVLQTPASWHWSAAVQTVGAPAWQVPPPQTSPLVQALASEQDAVLLV